MNKKISINGIELIIDKRTKRGYAVFYDDPEVGTLYLYVRRYNDLPKLAKLLNNRDFVETLKHAEMVLPANSYLRLIYTISNNIDSLIVDNNKLNKLLKTIENRINRQLQKEEDFENKIKYIESILDNPKYSMFDTLVYNPDTPIKIFATKYLMKIIKVNNEEKALLIIKDPGIDGLLNTEILLIDRNGDLYLLDLSSIKDEKKYIIILYKLLKYLEKKDFNKVVRLILSKSVKLERNILYKEYAEEIVYIMNKNKKFLTNPDFELFRTVLSLRLL